MPRFARRSRRPLVALCGVTLSALVALTGCSGTPSAPGPTASDPAADASPAGELTRQQTIARGRDLTLRVEVTTCTGYGSGSGYLVGPRLIATSAHVVKGAQTVAVRSATGGSVGTVIGTDDERDVALIKTTEDVGVGDPLVFADDEPQQGDDIVVIGYPEGRPQTPTSGTVSRVGQSVDIDKRRLNDLVQFDADARSASSGGPLLDLHGAVVGMTEEGKYDYTAGLNYAMSSKTARPLLKAWTDSPAEVIPDHCPKRSTAVADRSDSGDGPGIAFSLRQYFDSLNAAVATRDNGSYESAAHYRDAFDMFSGRLVKQYGPFNRFRDERRHVHYSTVRVMAVRHVDEVTDRAEVSFQRTTPSSRTGKDVCSYYHYRYQMRLATGTWTIDQSDPLADNKSRC